MLKHGAAKWKRVAGLPVGLAALTLLLPARAWACGVCTDNMVERLAWWATFPLWFLVALLADAVLFRIYRVVRRLPVAPVRRWRTLAVALLIIFLIFVLMAVGGGSIIPAALASLAGRPSLSSPSPPSIASPARR